MIFLMMMITMINLLHLLQYNLPVSHYSSLPSLSSSSRTSAANIELSFRHHQLDSEINDNSSTSTSNGTIDLVALSVIEEEANEGGGGEEETEAATEVTNAIAARNINDTDETIVAGQNFGERGSKVKRGETSFVRFLSSDIRNSLSKSSETRNVTTDQNPYLYTRISVSESPSIQPSLSSVSLSATTNRSLKREKEYVFEEALVEI